MSEIAVIINDENGDFKDYQIIKNKTLEEAQKTVKNYNEGSKEKWSAYIVTDKTMIAVILKKESKVSMEFWAKNIKESVEDMQNDFSMQINNLESSLRGVNDFLKATP